MVVTKLEQIKHSKPDHSHPKHVPKHADHDLVSKRHEKYIKAIIDNDIEAQLKFYSPSAAVVDMSYGTAGASAPASQLRIMFQRAKDEFLDVQYTTKSLNGTKHFTVWEYDCALSNLISLQGEKVGKRDARPHVLSVASLIWWNEDDKIEKVHEYTIHRDVEAVKQESEQGKTKTAS